MLALRNEIARKFVTNAYPGSNHTFDTLKPIDQEYFLMQADAAIAITGVVADENLMQMTNAQVRLEALRIAAAVYGPERDHGEVPAPEKFVERARVFEKYITEGFRT